MPPIEVKGVEPQEWIVTTEPEANLNLEGSPPTRDKPSISSIVCPETIGREEVKIILFRYTTRRISRCIFSQRPHRSSGDSDQSCAMVEHGFHVGDLQRVPYGLPAEACAEAEHVAHVGDLRCVPVESLIESSTIEEHVAHVGDVRHVPAKGSIEAPATMEHEAHVGDVGCVPRREIPTEVHATEEHELHVGDIRCVPARDILIEVGASSECSPQRTTGSEDRRFITEYRHLTFIEHQLH